MRASFSDRLSAGRIHNLMQTVLILAVMGGIFGLLGWLILGAAGFVWALFLGVGVLVSSSRVSPRMVLRMYGARELAYADAPGLHALTQELARRAGLGTSPRLFYVPSRVMNAFSVGRPGEAAITLSDGLLRHLDRRELIGVMAHEMAHIANNDLRLHALADMLTRVSSLLSFLGQVLILLYLPLMILMDTWVPVLPILVLLLAPSALSLLQLALSRTREFNADLGAARLTGDPQGLASALGKLESSQGSLWETLFLPGRRVPAPSILRTHPHTGERVRRLREIAGTQDPETFPGPDWLQERFPVVHRSPRWHWLGPWY